MADTNTPSQPDSPRDDREDQPRVSPPPLPSRAAEESRGGPQEPWPEEPSVFRRRKEPPAIEPAEMPQGFWTSADYLLRNPDRVIESIRRDQDLWRISRILFLVALGMSVIYGAVMGATDLLQGASMALEYKALLILVTGIKVPALFLLTLFIVLPPIYVSNAFMGARLAFTQILAMLLLSTAGTATVLASMASVAFFFALTTQSYEFIKLLHVLFFAYAGATGLLIFIEAARTVSGATSRQTPRFAFLIWLLLYIFVGTQLAWVLRPFVGAPNEPFMLFRERKGNFYESVWGSMSKLIESDKTKR
ncbi:MAG: hypothetical protein NTX50_12755 [Candidatus Sumerlaeota bacterium]|nr:hypothetical protein [Candidatus Sumerlaeota bacterium]